MYGKLPSTSLIASQSCHGGRELPIVAQLEFIPFRIIDLFISILSICVCLPSSLANCEREGENLM